jgi:pantothenate kinase type III
MIKTLCLDFGNTRLKAAVFFGEDLHQSFILKDEGVDDLISVIK